MAIHAHSYDGGFMTCMLWVSEIEAVHAVNVQVSFNKGTHSKALESMSALYDVEFQACLHCNILCIKV